MSEYFSVPVDEFELEIIRHKISVIASPAMIKNMNLKTWSELATDNIVKELELFLTGDRHTDTIKESLSYPETWWDALKERWFPNWLKKRFPVKLRTVGIKIQRTSYFICPHLNFDYSPHQLHLRFFLTNPRNWK